MADGPVGSPDELGLVGPRGMSLQIDIKKVFTTDEPANSVGTSPSSDSGIHSLGEQWEDMSVFTTNTEEGDATLGTLIDCVLKHESDESSDIDMRDNDIDSQGNENVEFYSDQELTTDESSYDEYEPWSNDLQHTSIMRDPVDPPGMSHLHRQNSVQQCEDGSSVWTETDGGNSDICNLADFSSEE